MVCRYIYISFHSPHSQPTPSPPTPQKGSKRSTQERSCVTTTPPSYPCRTTCWRCTRDWPTSSRRSETHTLGSSGLQLDQEQRKLLHEARTCSTWVCTVHGCVQYMGVYSTWVCTVHGLVQCMGLYSTWACTVHGLVQYMGLYSAWACTVHRLVQYMGLYSAWACTVHGLYSTWACTVQYMYIT